MDLKSEIEKKRREMEELAFEKGLGSPEVLKVSQELDQLLNQFQSKKVKQGVY